MTDRQIGRAFFAVVVAISAAACEDPLASSVTGSVSVTPAIQSVAVGQTVKVYATGSSTRGNPYALGTTTWSSSADSIATVTGSAFVDPLALGTQVEATVSGLSPGTVLITISTQRAGSASATVTVTP